MFTFYKVSVHGDDWRALFIDQDGKETDIKNDKGALERLLSKTNYLVGFNNYQFDDKVLASILRDLSLKETMKRIKFNRFKMSLQNPITLDAVQEIRNIEIEEVRANLLQDINITNMRKQVETIKEVFEKRESYFSSKFQIVKEFSLPAENVKKTRANLAAEVLKSRKKTDKERLNIIFDKRLNMSELPKEVVGFYKNIIKKYESGQDYQSLEKERFIYKLNGLDHLYGFGGLHAAKEKYVGTGNYMLIDISSYYPSLIINNKLIDNLADYKKIYDARMKFKKAKDPKEEVYKVLLSIVYGSMKNPYSNFYNPQAANIVTVNGQLILTHLILLLSNFCELIQSNTDGIVIKYEDHMKHSILKIIELFGERYDLALDIDYIKRIAQRDVNNYVMVMEDDKIIARGLFSKFEGGDFERNSMTIVDEALVNYLVHNVRPNRTIMKAYKNDELHKFQNIVKAGSFDGMAKEIKDETLFEGTYTSSFEDVKDVNRVFASRSELDGTIYKVRKAKDVQYVKTPYTSDNCFVHNGPIEDINKRRIDLNWYIKRTNELIF